MYSFTLAEHVPTPIIYINNISTMASAAFAGGGKSYFGDASFGSCFNITSWPYSKEV